MVQAHSNKYGRKVNFNNCRFLPIDKRSLNFRPDIIKVMKDVHTVALVIGVMAIKAKSKSL